VPRSRLCGAAPLLPNRPSWHVVQLKERTHPSIQWVSEALSLGVKQLRHEADHSPSYGAENKKLGAIHPLPNMAPWHGDHLIKAQGQLYLYLYL